MFTETQLEEYLDRHKLSEEARQVIRTIRNSEPARRVKSGAFNVACRYASRKMGRVIQAESHKNELAAVVEWDFDSITHEMYDQPPKIKLSYRNSSGKLVTHMSTTDFFLLQEGFQGYVENKTEEWLQARAAEGCERYVRDTESKWRCPPGEKYAEQFGLGFKVRSSAEINWKRQRNTEFLADYLDERCSPVKEADAARVYESMCGQAWQTLKYLIDCGCDADAIFKMVVDGQLYFDFDMYLLTEPERALIFRDSQVVEAYRIHLESKMPPAIAPIRPVKIESGSLLVWDSKPWRILNVGADDVFMEDEEHILTSLPKDVLEQMVRDGIITGLPEQIARAGEVADGIIRNASPSDFRHALYRYQCMFPEKFSSAQQCASTRAVRKWRGKFRRNQQSSGSGFLGLLPAIHRRGNRERKIDEEVIKIMKAVIEELFAQPGARTLVSCWGEVQDRCVEKGLAPPGERTFRKEIKRLSSDEYKEEREGKKATYTDSEFFWVLESTTPRHGERPFEIGHIDHTELDLQFVGERKGEKLGKAWLTVLIDANTRKVLAWVLMFDAPSYRSCMSVIRECIKHHGRIPKYIVVDKGSDFESEYFECLLARLESHKKTRPGSKPRFGSVIERFFGMSNTQFVHNLLGNNKALQKPRQMSASHDPRDLAVWTLPAFKDAFDGYLNKVYSCMEHSTLGMSPKEAMAIGMTQSGLRKHILIPYTTDFIIMCLPSTKKGAAKVDAGRGVKVGYIYYWTPEFRDPLYARTNVPARYDPFDASTAFVWLKNRWVKCRSELAAEFQGRSEKEINAATLEIRARQKRGGIRRSINAQMIATYLREVAGTEEGLRQLSRQQDSNAANDFQVVPQELKTTHDIDTATSSQDGWNNLNIKIFGEF